MAFPSSSLFSNADANVRADPAYEDAAAKARITNLRGRLQQCSSSDPSHITPGSTGPQVAAIQLALDKLRAAAPVAVPPSGLRSASDEQMALYNDAIRAVRAAPVSATERQSGTYGTSTANAVLAFKRAHDIRRFKGAAVDDIVGIQTINMIDQDLFVAENGRLPSTPVPPVFRGGFKFDQLTAGGFKIKFAADNLSKADLLDTPITSGVDKQGQSRALKFFVLAPGGATSFACQSALKVMVAAGGSNSTELATFFINNSTPNVTRIFPSGSFWPEQVRGDRSFTANHAGLSEAIRRTLQEYADSQTLGSPGPDGARRVQVNLLAIDAVLPPPFNDPPDTGTPLKAFANDIDFGFQSDPARLQPNDPGRPLAFGFGRIQGLTVELTSFTGNDKDGTYNGTLRYSLVDHYGTDPEPSGIIDPGQAGQFLLQRRAAIGQDKTRFRPYRSIIVVDGVAFSGRLQ